MTVEKDAHLMQAKIEEILRNQDTIIQMLTSLFKEQQKRLESEQWFEDLNASRISGRSMMLREIRELQQLNKEGEGGIKE